MFTTYFPLLFVFTYVVQKHFPADNSCFCNIFFKLFFLGSVKHSSGLYMKEFKILYIYTIPGTQIYEQSYKTDLKSSGTLSGLNLKNRIIFEKRAFFLADTVSIPRKIEPGSLMTGSKRVTHWTSETVYEWSEIAGSPQNRDFIITNRPLWDKYIFLNNIENNSIRTTIALRK